MEFRNYWMCILLLSILFVSCKKNKVVDSFTVKGYQSSLPFQKLPNLTCLELSTAEITIYADKTVDVQGIADQNLEFVNSTDDYDFYEFISPGGFDTYELQIFHCDKAIKYTTIQNH